MSDLPMYPTDQAICRLLAVEALPTSTIAHRLGLPDRTARHRLGQLRRAGLVVSGTDGLHRLAAGPLLGLADPAPALAAGSESDAPAPGHASQWGSGTVLVLAALGLGVAGSLAVGLLVSRMQTPAPSPAPPSFRPAWPGYVGGPPEGLGWSQW